jgi:hypothetical protein
MIILLNFGMYVKIIIIIIQNFINFRLRCTINTINTFSKFNNISSLRSSFWIKKNILINIQSGKICTLVSVKSLL